MPKYDWPKRPITDAEDKRDRERKTKVLFAQGMSKSDIARKLGVSWWFVYVTLLPPGERAKQRKANAERCRVRDRALVSVECSECGGMERIQADSLKKRRKRGTRPFRCQGCRYSKRASFDHVEAVRLVSDGTPTKEVAERFGVSQWTVQRLVSTAWMRPDELESPRTWARRVFASMTASQRRVFAEMELPDSDDSRPARHRKTGRGREEFRPYPYAKLDKPFGADLRGEKAA